VDEGRIDPVPLAAHHFRLDEIMDAYDTFANAAETDALKVVPSAA
jgi:alcohol dehydrogenase